MRKRLLELEVANFRSLREVTVPLKPLNVLVGPNGVGKTNVLDVFRFLCDIVNLDIRPSLDQRGGFAKTAFRGDRAPTSMRIKLTSTWSPNSRESSPDVYELTLKRRRSGGKETVSREETFQFKRTKGPGRRIKISGQKAVVATTSDGHDEGPERSIGLSAETSGLSTLPRLDEEAGGKEVLALTDALRSFRVFEMDVELARMSSRVADSRRLQDDGANLAAFLMKLQREHPETWERLVDDARTVLPHLEGIFFEFPSGPAREVIVVLHEKGLRMPTQLGDASYGTIRLLGLLALLYDPSPPLLTCIEEIDHGLHPHALELLVNRLREASERTQFLIATHSPALADRLRPDEIIVCERDEDGASRIPALDTDHIRAIVEASEDLPLGELWFSGALGGALDGGS
ncbi:AAA family ATPase [Nocardiopsis suaedae]|uniref:AAA family ATPase n=1 Tax=Nocardiopsis suaedae TaxID=3018444 RepID=A0ABT4TPM6_9ACTN|nr:AAA family ATPase [Nocardiopsis suaedae]MDA2806633.1 AAA family ATPase [Nocardiopsis suaedae]